MTHACNMRPRFIAICALGLLGASLSSTSTAAGGQRAGGHVNKKGPGSGEDAHGKANCEGFSPLFAGMDRAVDYWAKHGINSTTVTDAAAKCTGDCVHIKIYENQIYIKAFKVRSCASRVQTPKAIAR